MPSHQGERPQPAGGRLEDGQIVIGVLGEHARQLDHALVRQHRLHAGGALHHVMIGEDSSTLRDKKSGAENIQAYFRTIAGKAHEWVVVFVGRGFATARESGVMQSRSASVIAETKHNMDQADAGSIGPDNRLRECAFGLKLVESVLYCG